MVDWGRRKMTLSSFPEYLGVKCNMKIIFTSEVSSYTYIRLFKYIHFKAFIFM